MNKAVNVGQNYVKMGQRTLLYAISRFMPFSKRTKITADLEHFASVAGPDALFCLDEFSIKIFWIESKSDAAVVAAHLIYVQTAELLSGQ